MQGFIGYWIPEVTGMNTELLEVEFRQFVRRYPIEATPGLFHPQAFLAPPVHFLAPSSFLRVVTPQCPFVGRCATVVDVVTVTRLLHWR
jgi:hypothetical protein